MKSNKRVSVRQHLRRVNGDWTTIPAHTRSWPK